ncbi:MAG: hypothetical protein AABX53_00590 [Nanoarchaeota archaeon]
MVTDFFGYRKENVSEAQARDYALTLERTLMRELGFDVENGKANVMGGFTRQFVDAGGSVVEHLQALILPPTYQPRITHINLFAVRSILPDQVLTLRNEIKGYSEQLGYVFRDGLGDALAVI